MTIETIKNLRIALDEKFQVLKLNSEEGALGAYTGGAALCVMMARMWTGQVLKELGTENPYPNSMKPDNAIVDPPADVSQAQPDIVMPVKEVIEFVKMQRVDLEEIIALWKYYFTDEYQIETTPMRFLAIERVLSYLIEAKMLLGMELHELGEAVNRREAEKRAEQE